MASTKGQHPSTAYQQIYTRRTLLQNYNETELTSDAPLARYNYRIRQSLVEVKVTFGNSPRQQKKKRKFSNRWRISNNYHLEELLKCLCRG